MFWLVTVGGGGDGEYDVVADNVGGGDQGAASYNPCWRGPCRRPEWQPFEDEEVRERPSLPLEAQYNTRSGPPRATLTILDRHL